MGHTIHCPSCRHEFELSAVMRAELEDEVRAALAKQFEGQASALQAKLAAAATKEADLLRKQREVAEKEQRLELDIERRLDSEIGRIREQEATAARERFSREAEDRVRQKDAELVEAQAKLAAACAKEAGLMKKERELADRTRELAVETERRVVEEVARAREHEAKLAERRAEIREEQERLRDEEHRLQIAGFEKTITELTRKLHQGSQQAQGEAQEVVLRDVLAGAFAHDTLEDVPKGVRGADVVHTVRGPDGRDCASIVWESKRTRHWSDTWLAKVRDDQREAGAACAVIVTQALPSDIRHFGMKEGVWVCAPAFAVPLGAALRGGLVEVAVARRAAEGSGQKMQLLYEYINGAEFRNRVGGLLEAFTDMQADLASERRATLTRWKRREKMMERALGNIAGLGGELQGIVGRELDDLLPAAFDPVRALPEHAGGDDLVGGEDEMLKQLLLNLLPHDGGSMGNGSLTETFVSEALTELGLAVTAEDYDRCKEALLFEGRIRRGKGRGGSVSRVVASAAE